MNRGIAKFVWWTLGVFSAFFVVIALVSICDCEALAIVSKYIEKLSALIAVADDLIVRLAGVAILLTGVIGYIYYLVEGLSKPKNPKWGAELFKIAGVGAAMGLGGAAFLGSYVLDEEDQAAEALLAGRASAISVKTLARWVQVVPAAGSPCVISGAKNADLNGKECPIDFVVRVVIAEDKNCPAVKISFSDGSSARQRLRIRRKAPGPGFESIRVCEVRLKYRVADKIPLTVTFADRTEIPVAKDWTTEAGPGGIVIFGDTGCRADDKQRCNVSDWPLIKVIDEARDDARTKDTNLVLHVGDYMYVKFDVWETWRASFFDAAKPLLEAAPWVMVRGNHERCGEHGDAPNGFSLFFGITDARHCDSHKGAEPPPDQAVTETYGLDLSNDLRLIVADSATAFALDCFIALNKGNNWKAKCAEALDGKISEADNTSFQEMSQVLRQVASLAKDTGKRKHWLVTHVPVFAVDHTDKKNGKAEAKNFIPPTTVMMLAAWRDVKVAGINTIVSGDRHLFQLVEEDGGPLQVIVGTGGVDLDPLPFEKSPCTTQNDIVGIDSVTVPPAKKPWKLCSYREWGYVVAERNGQKYDFKFKRVTP